MDALLQIGALELRPRAGDGGTVLLVGVVEAVVVAVAFPTLRDTVARTFTCKLCKKLELLEYFVIHLVAISSKVLLKRTSIK